MIRVLANAGLTLQLGADANVRRRLPAVSLIWLLVTAALVGVFLFSLPTYFEALRTRCLESPCTSAPMPPPGLQALRALGLFPTLYAAYFVVLDMLVATVCVGVAAVIVLRQSASPVALLGGSSLVLWGLVTAPTSHAIATLAEQSPTSATLWDMTASLGLVVFSLFFYLFPNGRFVPRWAGLVAAATLILPLLATFPGSIVDYRVWPPALTGVVLLAWLGGIVGVQVYRYARVSDLVERQQTKWVVSGLTASLVGFFVALSLPALLGAPDALSETGDPVRTLWTNTAASVAILLLPLSMGAAVVRHRLWDIDVLIHRALVYAALSGCVLAVYVAVVGGLGAMFQAVPGPVLPLLATALVALVVQPARDRFQSWASRVVYGQRDEPYAALAGLGRRLETTLAPEAVLSAIVTTVSEALRLPYAGLTLAAPGSPTVARGQSAGRESELLRLPLTYQAEAVGDLLLAPRAPRDAFSASDLQLLNDLARHAGVAAHAVRLTTELQESRGRLVNAREEERRRLRRDLHDGLGPALASLGLLAETARDTLGDDAAQTDALLAELIAQLQMATADIRRLVYELRPPALDDLGRIGAVRAHAARYGDRGPAATRVEVAAPGTLPALPAAVEVAAYRIIQEALTNVLRHAQARRCWITLDVPPDPDGRSLRVEVLDNGRGLPEVVRAGVGLTSMRERAEELGGCCRVTAEARGGTRVVAMLPLPSGVAEKAS